MSGRNAVSAALFTGLGNWLVVDTARQLDVVVKPTAVVWCSKRSRIEMQQVAFSQDTVEVWVLTDVDRPDMLEDALDANLEQVLSVIEEDSAMHWTDAERAVLAEKHHGWHLTVTVVYRIN